MSATEEEIGNASAWAEIIEDMLWAVPSDVQEDVLNLALANYHERKSKAESVPDPANCWITSATWPLNTRPTSTGTWFQGLRSGHDRIH
jgi:hypothetical protein